VQSGLFVASDLAEMLPSVIENQREMAGKLLFIVE
jgi:hypothetical protein